MSLGQDLVEEILGRLPVKSLLKFKSVSKTWQMTIESPFFKKKHMTHQQSQEPDLLLIHDRDDDDLLKNEELIISTLALNSFDSITGQDDLQSHQPELALSMSFDDVSRSCDGLVCIYNFGRFIRLFNPSTKWMREVPPRFQPLLFDRYKKYEPNLLGFGKDICTGTYKLVWLYNSFELDLGCATTCEVFDFNINTWRDVKSSPYRILSYQHPIYVDGSLYWYIYMSDSEIKILYFNCHTEIFQVISDSPITQEDQTHFSMCNMNDRMYVSEKKWPEQAIWRLDSSNMTWEKMFSLDLSSFPDGLLSYEMWPIACPLAILKNKKLLLFDGYDDNPNLVVYDLETRSYSLYFDAKSVISVAPYFQSLMSIS